MDELIRNLVIWYDFIIGGISIIILFVDIIWG